MIEENMPNFNLEQKILKTEYNKSIKFTLSSKRELRTIIKMKLLKKVTLFIKII